MSLFADDGVVQDLGFGGYRPRRVVDNAEIITLIDSTRYCPEHLATAGVIDAGLVAERRGTELVLTHEQFADSEARDKHQHGWNGCLDRFGRYLSH